MFVGESVTFGEFFEHIHSNTLDFIILNNEGEGYFDYDAVIEEGYKLEVYYEQKLDTFYIGVGEHLSFDDSVVVDTPNSMIKRIHVGSDVAWLKGAIDTSGSIAVYNNGIDGPEANDDEVLRTGDILVINLGDRKITYTLSILGDVTGDGRVLINDVALLYSHLKGRRVGDDALSTAEIEAGDANGSNSILINDVALIYQYVKGNEGALSD